MMKLLFAEDDRDLSRAVRTLLEHSGYAVDVVSNGEDAIDYASTGEYDGLILDWMMPEKDGISVLRSLRTQGISTPCLMLTARDSVEDRVAGLDAGADDYITPVVDRMRELLIQRDVLHADETPVQVLKEPGKKPQTKSYMWLYRTGNDGEAPIILYDYRPSRSGDNAEEYIKGFSGYLHTDGYSGYNKLTGVTRCGCWAHLRRKFDEALPIGKASEANGSYAQQGIAYCNKLFQIEAKLTDMSPEDRYNKRLELEKPVLEVFWSWLDSFVPLRGSKLATAVTYARNQKPYLENYLLDGRCSISNNIAENAIRPFVTGRKNWLFADTPKGAAASAAIYSIVETAKANGLDVFLYLEQLLMHMTDWDHSPEYLDKLMPWSESMQETCGK